jgi:glutaminyl-tRNA synthetase
VEASSAVDAEVRLYDRLFNVPEPDAGDSDFVESLNPDSLEVVQAKLERSLADLPAGECVQFERLGYFCLDRDTGPGQLVFNRTITLRDSWAKQASQK